MSGRNIFVLCFNWEIISGHVIFNHSINWYWVTRFYIVIHFCIPFTTYNYASLWFNKPVELLDSQTFNYRTEW